MTSRSERPAAPRVPLALVPVAIYLVVTLLAPALRGAARLEGFPEHATITLAVTGLLTGLWLAVRPRRRRCRTEAPTPK